LLLTLPTPSFSSSFKENILDPFLTKALPYSVAQTRLSIVFFVPIMFLDLRLSQERNLRDLRLQH
jgi:hypothetical protein